MAEAIIKRVLAGELQTAPLVRWLAGEKPEEAGAEAEALRCGRLEFTADFLAALRTLVDGGPEGRAPEAEGGPRSPPEAGRAHRRSNSEPSAAGDPPPTPLRRPPRDSAPASPAAPRPRRLADYLPPEPVSPASPDRGRNRRPADRESASPSAPDLRSPAAFPCIGGRGGRSEPDPARLDAPLRERLDALSALYAAAVDHHLAPSVLAEVRWLVGAVARRGGGAEGAPDAAQAAWFAARALWHLRDTLAVLLDAPALRRLGEARPVRLFCPELAKWLLNAYGVRSEGARGARGAPGAGGARAGVVCFNPDTDRADSFPSAASFHAFKRQRDMFYEIVRWYEAGGGAGGGLRSRVKALVSAGGGGGAACLAHLGALVARHLLAECAPPAPSAPSAPEAESRMLKLRRRLVCPAPLQAHGSPREAFYRDLVSACDHEGFRAHVRDALATELLALDRAPPGGDSGGGAGQARLLARLLGHLAALPYAGAEPRRGRRTDVELALRDYSQPALDVAGCVARAASGGRLVVTLPWAAHYLAALDATALRTAYHRALLKEMLRLRSSRLRPPSPGVHPRTRTHLACVIGWLMAQPHVPTEVLYECEDATSCPAGASGEAARGPDSVDVAPGAGPEAWGGAGPLVAALGGRGGRHVTPLAVALPPAERLAARERSLAARLEEELVRAQPHSTRRVLEVVTERAAALARGELSRAAVQARAEVRSVGASLVADHLSRGDSRDPGELRALLQGAHEGALRRLQGDVPRATKDACQRALGALGALLPAGTPRALLGALTAVARRGARGRVDKWVAENWTSTAVLCDDIDAEIRALTAAHARGDASDTTTTTATTTTTTTATTPTTTTAVDTSPPAALAMALIELRELLWEATEGEPPPAPLVAGALQAAAGAVGDPRVARGPQRRAALRLATDLALACASRGAPLSEPVLQALGSVWGACGATGGAGGAGGGGDDRSVAERLVCARTVALVGGGARGAAQGAEGAVGGLVLHALRGGAATTDQLSECCLALYRRDWPEKAQGAASCVVRAARSAAALRGDPQPALVLDFLAEYCAEL